MKSFQFLSVQLLVNVVLVASTPLLDRSSLVDKVFSTKFSSIAGAVFVQTNGLNGNYILSANIESSGTLSLSRAVYTGGSGSHGIDTPTFGGDPLFSQGSLAISSARNILAVVNAGSDTVSAFRINPFDPSDITPLGKPVATTGQFPTSLAFSGDGSQLCVLTSGKSNGINCYTVYEWGLVPQANSWRSIGLNITTPPSGPTNTIGHIKFTDDGHHLIAAVKAAPAGYLAIWDVAWDGTLSKGFTKVYPAAGGAVPFAVNGIPGKSSVIVADPSIGADVIDLSNIQTASNNSLNSNLIVPGQGAICWISYSKQIGNFYLVDANKAVVTEVHVDDHLRPSIVQQYSLGTKSALDADVATIRGQDFLYVLDSSTPGIKSLTLRGASKATLTQSVNFGAPAQNVGLTVDPFYITGLVTYVRNS
ncbi:hypothetical protein BV25DRAFT_1917512 [Artomyces pyxidatus]|uniref:Uncharacterized protein n=1 Tax=Artomyces pyxidatus TaxID=48021 RepID=A0ACB8SWV1_9AGAM|nr:hypothetical protein BV25DRAFT_1917512 [Artomyces pyxidatus]